jgi:hypothetical protein
VKRAIGVLLLALAWLLPAAGNAQTPVDPTLAAVEVRRDGAQWTAEFRLARAAPAWVFVHSALTRIGNRPWRPQSWTVETQGVRLERHGAYDLLVAAGGGPVPRNVRIRFRPATDDLVAAYDPALVFTDGSVALYSEQFDLFPYASASAAERLPIDLARSRVNRSRTRVTFRDSAGPVFHAGRRSGAVTIEDDDGSYILFGRAEPIETEAMAAIIDPALPAWIRASLTRAVPDIFRRYAAALGPAPGPKPTVMVSWAGPTTGVTSMGGSTLPGLIVMAYEGDRLLAESPAGRSYGLWFIAHEAAHFWLGNAVSYQYSRDAWITEGGADLLAFRTVAAVDPSYDPRIALNESIRDCASLTVGRGVASAETRGEQRAYYACGAVFALVVESSSREPFTAFVRAMIEGNGDDRMVTRGEWLAALDDVSGDRSLSRDIARLLDRGAADPKAAIASLFTRAGVAFSLGEDGMPRLR